MWALNILLIEKPIMRKIGTYKYHISRGKWSNMIPYKLCPRTGFKIDKFQLFMIMPFIVILRLPIMPVGKRLDHRRIDF